MTARHLHISTQLSLPTDVVTQTIVVYGGKGMGKTNFGTVLAEELALSKQRFSVIDPMGVFWGLRHSTDGKGDGIAVLILGGKHGDIPIEPTGGAVVADLVADESVNVIIDISRKPDGKAWSKSDRIRFVADYCTRLMERQAERSHPIMQIIDEAGRYCPQMIPHGSPDLARCVGAIESMVEEGRNFGIGVTLITQRSARMNKSVSELADCMIAFRTIGPNSVEAILDWFGEHVEKPRWKELIEKLRALPRGTALVVSPGWLQFEGIAAIRVRTTFDSSATPKAGHERHAQGEGKRVDLDRYRERMAATIEKVKADDPKALRQTIFELRKEVTKLLQKKTTPASVPAPPPKVVEKLVKVPEIPKEVFALVRTMMIETERVTGTIDGYLSRLRESGARTATSLHALRESAVNQPRPGTLTAPAPPIKVQWPTRQQISDSAKTPTSPTGVDNNGDRKLSRSQIALLQALREAESIGRPIVSRPWLASIAKVSSKSSGFEKNISTLNTSGMIRYPSGGMITLTNDGRSHTAEVNTPLDSETLLERSKTLVSGPQGVLLDIVFRAYPKPISREQLAEVAGVSTKSSGFEKNVSTLSGREFITYPEPGMIRCADWLFVD